nr:l-type lectin-domain containing receptor kinase iv.1 [Quercus suber]
MLITITGAAYIIRRKKYEEILEDWESEYGPHRAFMLEVACGRRPVEVQGLTEEVILVDWVFECWRKGSVLDASDPRSEGNYVVEEMELVLKLGLLCSHSSPSARPSMRQVI